MLAMASVMMLFASCGTSKVAQGSVTTETGKSQTASTKASNVQQNEAVRKLTFVQKVSDNQVYAKNIVGSMSFNLQAGGKDITVPGKLSMRKDEVIRIQLFIPILGTEVGRLEFTPNYVLIVDRLHKEYIKADYTQVDFLKKQGISFYSLQALFWNQLLLPGVQKLSESDLKKFDANLNVAGDAVPVTIKNGNMTYTWQANKSTGRITSADVLYKSGQYGTSNVHIDYSDFKNVGVKLFPATQRLSMMTTATQKKQEMKINLELNEVKTDSNWSTQTEISSKYKQVSPEDVLRKIMSL
mgnify:CR=1 FL=1